ncbi:MAG: multiubiquitin domain-containing protein [Luteolibacter sp.]
MNTNNNQSTTGIHAGGAATQTNKPQPKYACVVGDMLFPMPRAKLSALTILEQAGYGADFVLVRDHGGPDDVTFSDEQIVDLREGNVFSVAARCDHKPNSQCLQPAKLAYAISDSWELTLNPNQTRESLIRLFGLSAEVEILRDYESPQDEIIGHGAPVTFNQGAVLLVRNLGIKVKVNNHDVHLVKRRVTGREIKEAAVAQGVAIQVGFVLYRYLLDGSLTPAIGDDEVVTVKDCDSFNCIDQDDVS